MPDGNGNEVDEANGMLIPENQPVAWSADYSSERDLTLVADQVTGVYTFEVLSRRAQNGNSNRPMTVDEPLAH
ncbi:hypothetical protein [Halalkalicoccus salilacus]|uniref:hypothetical protein n=1 Tax=Halalkalicoccus TaxID=332246 RepID=UPI002F967057